MSLKTMNWAWAHRLQPTPKLILMALADEADDDGICWVRISRIAFKACVSERTVQRTIRTFVSAGRLSVSGNTRSDGSQAANTYRLVFSYRDEAGAVNAKPPGDKLTPVPGDKLSPQPDTSCQGGTTPMSPLGVTQTSPLNPSFNPVIRTTTDELDWKFLSGFLEEDRNQVVVILKKVSQEQRQDVLDELAGALRRKTIKGEWPAWLRSVAKNAMDGGFQPNLAKTIQTERKQRTEAERLSALRQIEAAERHAKFSTPEAIAKISAKLAQAVGQVSSS